MVMSIILAYKKRGETMGECLTRIKGMVGNEIMTYAGRLDPMAEGLVLLLSGTTRFLKDRFLGLPKQYQVDFFPGYQTDSYDILGIATQPVSSVGFETLPISLVPRSWSQPYPPYSSRKVSGKPLFVHARSDVSTTPQVTHQVTLLSGEVISRNTVTTEQLLRQIVTRVSEVVGDFRQNEIIKTWRDCLCSDTTIPMFSVRLFVSSGFYVRQWVSDVGNHWGTGAVTFHILRDTIGIFTMSMLNGEPYRIFQEDDPKVQYLTI